MILAGGLQILKIGEKMPEINSDFNEIQTMSFPGSWVFQPVEKLQIETNFWRILQLPVLHLALLHKTHLQTALF